MKQPEFSLAAQSAAGEGCGEGFPLPTKDDGADRRAIRANSLWHNPRGVRRAMHPG